jgi:peptide deformylase
MAIKEVVRMGTPILRHQSAKVPLDQIETPQMKELLTDLYDTMIATQGIGIAAPQIGISSQVAIIKIPENSKRYEGVEASKLFTIINPIIEVIDEETQGFWEGCLSVPGLRGFVERNKNIKVTFLDENAKSNTLELSGFIATVFQHEIDHLFGSLFVDKVTDLAKLAYEKEYQDFWLTE